MFCNSSSTFLLYLCGGLGSAGRLGSGLVNFIAIRRLCCSQVPTPGILSLIIYRTKAESSRETPDFASLQFFAQKREHLHSTADALYTCSIISNGLYLLFIISFRVLTYVFVGPYLKLLFLSIRRITFANLFSIHLPST